MSVFAIRIERPFDAAVQRPQDPDTQMHQKVAALGGADQATDRGLPLVELLVGLRKLHDVSAGVLEGDELAPSGSGIGSSNGRFQPRSAMQPRRANVGAAMIAHCAEHAWQ